MKGLVLGATIGDCVHVAGIQGFLRLAAAEGYLTRFLGTRLSPQQLVEQLIKQKPALLAISYRLTPETAAQLLAEFKQLLPQAADSSTRLVFGGTPPVAAVAERSGIFERSFAGTESLNEVSEFLRGGAAATSPAIPAQSLSARIAQSYPMPLLRHHYGRPSLTETVSGAARIAAAAALDVLSLGPDQNAQEYFFRPAKMNPAQAGAGGVPLRQPADLLDIYNATRCGNHPLLRCYSGTNDLERWAEMSLRTIKIAWGAIPLSWYSQLDGRSQRPLLAALRENLQAIRWYAQHAVPVEVNEAHQWSLRNAHDTVAVATAFLAAYNAKRCGVKHYVSQYMFNTPPGTTPRMDLAKMLAKQELIHSLEDEHFTVYNQVRAGLASLSPHGNIAKGQMAATAVISLAMRPHILHVVGFSEGDHAATADEVIESCEIARGTLQSALDGLPDCTLDQALQQRQTKLVSETRLLLQAIKKLAPTDPDPWGNPTVLNEAVQRGLLDAPGLAGAGGARSATPTAIIDGACLALDPATGQVLDEAERLRQLGAQPWPASTQEAAPID